jgi:hypothetical protein
LRTGKKVCKFLFRPIRFSRKSSFSRVYQEVARQNTTSHPRVRIRAKRCTALQKHRRIGEVIVLPRRMEGSMGLPYIEVIDSAELAQRLKVKESWVVDQSKRSRTSDPIPVFRLGKHRRYRWGSPEMDSWLERRAGTTTTRKVGSHPQKGEDG